MAEYVSAPFDVDPDALVAQVFDELRARVPGWEPADGNLDVWLSEAFAQVAAQVAEVASDVTDAIFIYYGKNIAGVPPIEASNASGAVTVTAIDSVGYTVPAGTTLAFQGDDGLVAFTTVGPAVIPAGETSVAAVQIVALEAGAAGSGHTGAATLIDELDFVASVALEGTTTNGQDAEDTDTYLNRLVEELALSTPRPILAEDYAVLAKRVAGVERAVGIDNYIPAGPGGVPPAQTNAERAVTIGVVGPTGEDVPTAVYQQVDDLFDRQRKANFIVNIVNPTITDVPIAYTVTAYDGFDKVALKAQIDAALATYVNPASWGQPTFGDRRAWSNEDKVRYLEVAQVINGVEGVRYVDSLSLNGGAAGVDVSLPGVAPLARIGAITGTVS